MNGLRLLFGLGGIHRIPLRSQRQRLLRQVFEQGFRSFDVAPAYGNGLNEVELGCALRADRSVIQITTKFGISVDCYGERYPVWFPMIRVSRKLLARDYGIEYRRREFSAADMVRSVNDSLRRMHTDYIDRLLIHEPLEPIDSRTMLELAEQATMLRREGKIRAFGIAGPKATLGNTVLDPCIDVVQTTLADAVGAFAGLGKRVVAYGVYQHYRMGGDVSSAGFAAFVNGMLSQHENLELILSSNSRRTLASFRPLFQ